MVETGGTTRLPFPVPYFCFCCFFLSMLVMVDDSVDRYAPSFCCRRVLFSEDWSSDRRRDQHSVESEETTDSRVKRRGSVGVGDGAGVQPVPLIGEGLLVAVIEVIDNSGNRRSVLRSMLACVTGVG